MTSNLRPVYCLNQPLLARLSAGVLLAAGLALAAAGSCAAEQQAAGNTRIESFNKAKKLLEREVYAGRAAKMAGVTAEAMNVEVRRELGIQRKRRKAAERREIRSPVGLAQPKDRSLAYTDMKSAKAEENVLRLLFSDQKLIAVAEKDLQPAWFSAPVLRKIYERVLELNRNDQMVDVLSFEGWLEPNEMSLLSAILEPGIPAGEHRGELQEYINTIRMQRVKDGTITQAGEDPLLTFGRIKKQNAGGQTI